MIIDTHVHLDDKSYIDDLEDVIENAKKHGIESMIIPAADPKDLPRAVQICDKYTNIYFAIGVHPYHAKEFDEKYLLKFAYHPKCVAVGECGLDYFRLPDDEKEIKNIKLTQKEAFVKQIKLAIKINKPLIIHIRDATADCKDILIQYDCKKVGGVLHCFNASPTLLDMAHHGFYFGIGGVVTFKNAKKLVEILPQIPKDRLLIETDGPYLTPHPHRGKRNEPSYTTFILEKISQILEIEESKLAQVINKNSKSLFKELGK